MRHSRAHVLSLFSDLAPPISSRVSGFFLTVFGPYSAFCEVVGAPTMFYNARKEVLTLSFTHSVRLVRRGEKLLEEIRKADPLVCYRQHRRA